MKLAQLTATSDLVVSQSSYIYQILPLRSRLATISSDDSLRLIDPVTLRVIPNGAFSNVHAGVTCLRVPKSSSDMLITAGRDAAVMSWDLRTGARAINFQDDRNGPYLSLACNDSWVAAGTELTNHQAAVSIWDYRNHARPIRRYVESHNDDITELAFHPTFTHTLLSGSTDSLINVYDTTLIDEDDVLIDITNHGSSIHHAGFLSWDTIFGLSHDETFSLYQFDLAQPTNKEADESADLAFGNLRKILGCEYVVDVLGSSDGESAVVAAGSHSNQYLDLVPLNIKPRASAKFDEDQEDTVRLVGAHGEEVVRSLCFGDDDTETVFTAGEDGCVKAWRVGPQIGQPIMKTRTQNGKKIPKREAADEEENYEAYEMRTQKMRKLYEEGAGKGGNEDDGEHVLKAAPKGKQRGC